MKLLCWNIKQFTTNKLTNADQLQVIKSVLEDWDVAVILEGPKDKKDANGKTTGQALADLLATRLGNGWQGNAVETPALGKEAESVLVVHKNHIEIADLSTIGVQNFPDDCREPISFKVKGTSAINDSKIEKRVMAWHAPPPEAGDRRYTCEAHIHNGEVLNGTDIFMGDFNCDYATPRNSGFQKLIQKNVATTLSNPNTERIDNMDNVYTKSAYDKIFVKGSTRFVKAGVVNVAKRVTAKAPNYEPVNSSVLSKRKRDDDEGDHSDSSQSDDDLPQNPEKKQKTDGVGQTPIAEHSLRRPQSKEVSEVDAIKMAYSASDHAPVGVEL